MLKNYFDDIIYTLHPEIMGMQRRLMGRGFYHQVIPFFSPQYAAWYATGLSQHNIEAGAMYTALVKRKHVTEYSP